MVDITLRTAELKDSNAIAQTLQEFAIEIGDKDYYQGTQDAINQYGFGSEKLFHCVLAEDDRTTVGLAIFFPTFSTTRGESGVYLQDLWVKKIVRGKGIARKIVQQVSIKGFDLWGATHMTLSVYTDNVVAVKFYESLEFQIGERERHAALQGTSFQKLISS